MAWLFEGLFGDDDSRRPERRPTAREEWRDARTRADDADRRARLREQPYPDFGLVWWLKIVVYLVTHSYVTLIWLVAAGLLGGWVFTLGVVLFFTWLACQLLKVSYDNWAIRWVLYGAPVGGDVHRLLIRRRVRKELEFGNALLREMGLVSWSDVREYPARFDFDKFMLWMDLPLAGATEENVAKKVELALPVVQAADFQFRRVTNSVWEIDFFAEKRVTALDSPQVITMPPAVDWDTMSVYVFYDEFGKSQPLSLSGHAASLVAGLPGSGKSAMISAFLTPLLCDPRVNVTVIDGKGASDYESLEKDVDLFFNDDTDFDSFIEILESKQSLMRERVQTNKVLTGQSNFWNSELTSERPVELIVIDECQAFFESSGRSKKEKESIERVIALVKDLVKRGRSAGVHVLLASQKPDSSSIPTAIRDLCGRRVAFRCTTREQALMVLGETPDGAPSPTEISAENIGACVVGSESGDLIQARAFYMPEKNIEAFLAQYGRPKSGPASSAAGDAGWGWEPPFSGSPDPSPDGEDD